MNSKTPQHYKIRVETILAWVAEQENILGMYSGQSLQPALPPPGPSLGHLAPPALFPPASAILDNPSVRETIADSIENMIPPLISTYQGNIILTHNQHTERLIQLFIILKDLKAPGKRGENLFKSFYNTDMVAILRQLEIYSDKKANTIQGKITEANDNLNYNDPKVEKLLKALTDFFYGPHS
jgi:hypothetical protein